METLIIISILFTLANALIFYKTNKKLEAIHDDMETFLQDSEFKQLQSNKISNSLHNIETKIDKINEPKKVITLDTYDLIEYIKKYSTKQRSCGGGSCGFKYMINSNYLDSLTKKYENEKNTSNNTNTN